MRRKRFLDCDFPLKQTSFCWERTGRHGNRPKAAGYRVWSYSAHTFSIKSLRLAMRGDDAACTRCSLPPSHLSKITLSSKSDPFISIWAKGGRKYTSLKELECLRKPSNGWGGGGSAFPSLLLTVFADRVDVQFSEYSINHIKRPFAIRSNDSFSSCINMKGKRRWWV